MIKLIIPANMEKTTEIHLKEAGYEVDFINGRRFGVVKSTGDLVAKLRSYDIPIELDISSDVALVGSDWLEEHRFKFLLNNLEVLGVFSYGRMFHTIPTLDLVAQKDFPISNPAEIQAGTIICTEHPNLTGDFLREYGKNFVVLGQNQEGLIAPREFSHWCAENELVGIRIVHGSIPGLLGLGSDLGVMVNESGKTLDENGLKVVKTIREIQTLLLVNRDSLDDPAKAERITKMANALVETFYSAERESESAIIHREREI